jgi:hypothetical protein
MGSTSGSSPSTTGNSTMGTDTERAARSDRG